MVTPHLHKQLARGIAGILNERRHGDRVIERMLRPLPLHAPQRALVAETVYGVVRHLRRLFWALGKQEAFDLEHIGACIRAWWVLHEVPLPPTLRRGIPPRQQLLARWEHPPSRAVRYSIPDWLDQYGAAQCAERWEAILASLNKPPQLVLRTNTLQTSRSELVRLLENSGIAATAHPFAPEAILLERYANVFALEPFHAGMFEMQDAASQAMAHILDPAPGMRVVDACAGSGGKTLHLAALMQNKGKIIALDIAAWKLTELRRRAARAGVSIIETRPITSTKTIKRLDGTAERLLLDLPCSGSGVWRRNPDGKWHLGPEDLPRLQTQQRDIVQRYLSMLAPGGRVLLCTCSIFPDEGERHLEWLVQRCPQMRMLAHGRFDPAEHSTDGFFWALLLRE
ncbi:MAG: RNA methyltransferase [Candidatus Kapaibacterium sp.]|nr:MAG: RNA methyltransferase [Candidatus Kapabacteria bacterium]